MSLRSWAALFAGQCGPNKDKPLWAHDPPLVDSVQHDRPVCRIRADTESSAHRFTRVVVCGTTQEHSSLGGGIDVD